MAQIGGDCPSFATLCGNLINNGSFETQITIPDCQGDLDANHVECWDDFFPAQRGTPDYYSNSYVTLTSGPLECIGRDFLPPGGTYANQGFSSTSLYGNAQKHFGGLFTIGTDNVFFQSTAYREYFFQPLLDPILPGESVTVQLQMGLGGVSNRATSLQVAFVTDAQIGYESPAGVGNYQRMIINNDMNLNNFIVTLPPITNNTGWQTTVPVTFTNNNTFALDKIVIGNFKTNSATLSSAITVTQTIPISASGIIGYYVIDDIVVKKNTGGCCDVDISINQNLPMNPLPVSYISSWTIPPGASVFVNGVLIIDQNFTFNMNDVRFGPDASIIVNANKELRIQNNSWLHGCDNMWRGIDATAPGAKVTANSSLIEDALIAIYSKNGNPVLSNNMRFWNNNVGIQLEDFTNTWSLTLRRTTFQSTGNLSPNSYPVGSRPEAGMIINNVGNVKLQFSGPVNKNHFRNMHYGLKITNSNFEISNANFYNIISYGEVAISTAIEIHNTISTALPLTAKINNDFGSMNITFCDNGIMADGKLAMNVHGVNFNNINKGLGIFSRDNTAFQINQVDIYENNFETVKYGIIFLDSPLLSAKVHHNTLTNLAGFFYIPGSRAISVVNSSGLNVKCGNDYPTWIYSNNITNYEDGIRLALSPCVNMEFNQITLSPPATNQHRGIFVESCLSPKIGVNTVVGNGQDWRNIGIRLFLSPLAEVYCNDVNNTGYGFWFDEDCDFSKVHHNVLNNYLYGMYFVNNAKLGPQYIGPGLLSEAFKNSWQKLNTLDKEIFVDQAGVSPVNPGQSVFYFDPTDTDFNTRKLGVEAIDNFNVSIAGTITDDADITGNTTSPSSYCGVFNPPSLIPGGVRPRFELGNIPFTQFGSANEVNSRWMFNHHILKTAAVYQDTLAAADLSVQTINFLDSLSNTELAGMMEVEDLILVKNFSSAFTQNQSITGTAGAFDYLKTVHEILIPYWDSIQHHHALNVTIEDLTTLTEVAALCPGEFGDAVIKARVFLQFYVNDSLTFSNVCELPYELRPGTRVAEIMEQSIDQSDLVIYPNPSIGVFGIKLTTGTIAQVSVLNINGQLLRKITNPSTSVFDISDFSPGIYLIIVTDTDGVFHLPKRIVIAN